MEFDRQKVVAWLNEQWGGPKVCPVCGHNDWAILERVWEAREYRKGGLVVGGEILPLISIMCNVCGYTMMFNAIAVGLVERAEKKEEEHG